MDDLVMFKKLQKFVEEGRNGTCLCGQYHVDAAELIEVLRWALTKLDKK